MKEIFMKRNPPSQSKKAPSRKRFKQRDSACEKFFLGMDDFKTPIQVSYNEETTANTICGGFLSLLLRLAIFLLAMQKFVTCFSRSQVSIVEVANYLPFPS